jgi:hypothetical protein
MGYELGNITDPYNPHELACSLIEFLDSKPEDYESWALAQVLPGLVVEERFTSFDSDQKAAIEFKVFVIWGRAYVAYSKRGLGHTGLFYRNGTAVPGVDESDDDTMALREVEEWISWDRVVELAESLGRNKDMHRVDIFCGIPAGHSALRK